MLPVTFLQTASTTVWYIIYYILYRMLRELRKPNKECIKLNQFEKLIVSNIHYK